MFRYGLVGIYFGYLLISGAGMASGLSNADKSNSKQFESNMCRLMGDSSKC